MFNRITGDHLIFLVGYPLVITAMLFFSALLGMKLQGPWLESSLYNIINRGPRPLRLVISALAGAVTPFCSCTTVPVFAALLEFRLGLDIAMAFLIASPLIDPAGTMLLLYLLGPRLTVIYTTGCFAAALAGGCLLGKFFSEKDDINPLIYMNCSSGGENISWSEAARRSWVYIKGFWRVIFLSCLAGLALYDFVPAGVIGMISSIPYFFSIPLATLLGLLVYAHMAVLLPAGAALLAKGANPGIVLAFIASSAGVSPPELMLLRSILSPKLIYAYVVLLIFMISFTGFLATTVGR